MISFIFSSLLSVGLTPCQWMADIRVWDISEECVLQGDYDFSQPIIKDDKQTSGNLSVVNIIGLELVQSEKCEFQAVQVNGSISNTVFVVNVSIDIPKECSESEVSIISHAHGSYTNINVTGFVNITSNNENNNLRLSSLFGNITNIDCTNISSSLQYNVTGLHNKTNYCNDFYKNLTKIGNWTSFDNLVNNNILQYNVSEVQPNKSYKFYNLVNDQYNPYFDYYEGGYSNYLQLLNDVQNSNVTFFDQNGSETNDSKKYFSANYATKQYNIIFTTNDSVVQRCSIEILALVPNNKVKSRCLSYSECKFIDISRKLCLDVNKSCDNLYENQIQENQTICSSECLMHLGYYLRENKSCAKCDSMASTSGCVQNCSKNQFVFQKGCYDNACPENTFFNNATNECNVITELNCKQCFINYKQINEIYFNQCVEKCPEWTDENQYENNRTCMITCSGTLHYNGTCVENLNATNKCNGLLSFVDRNVTYCMIFCSYDNMVEQLGSCVENCSTSSYKYKHNGQYFKSCLNCETQTYDNGIKYEITNNTCVSQSQCNHIIHGTSLCYNDDCKRRQKISNGTLICYDACPDDMFLEPKTSETNGTCIYIDKADEINCSAFYNDTFENVCTQYTGETYITRVILQNGKNYTIRQIIDSCPEEYILLDKECVSNQKYMSMLIGVAALGGSTIICLVIMIMVLGWSYLTNDGVTQKKIEYYDNDDLDALF